MDSNQPCIAWMVCACMHAVYENSITRIQNSWPHTISVWDKTKHTSGKWPYSMTICMWYWLSFRPQNWDYWGRLPNWSKVHRLLLELLLAPCGLNYGTWHWTMGNKVQSLCWVFITSWLTPVLSDHLAPSATTSKTDSLWTFYLQPFTYPEPDVIANLLVTRSMEIFYHLHISVHWVILDTW